MAGAATNQFLYDEYSGTARAIATNTGIPPNLFEALISHESSWSPTAIGTSGEIGLTQLMPGTAHDLGVNAWDAASNMQGGATYLKQQYDHFGNWRDALAAYNAGPGNVQAGYGYADTVLGMAGLGATSSGAPTAASVQAIPDSALPSTGNPVMDWLRGQFQQMFGGAYVNVPAGTAPGTTVTGPGGNNIGTVGTPAQAGPLGPTETVTTMLNDAKSFIFANAGIVAIIGVALLFAFFGVKSFLPGPNIVVKPDA